jgi:hypothetical protein
MVRTSFDGESKFCKMPVLLRIGYVYLRVTENVTFGEYQS